MGILGPGNQYVTSAKMQVQSDAKSMVAIDMPAGPSEVLVIADASADPEFVAADLLSQAEHGVDSQVVLVTVAMTPEAIANVQTAVQDQLLMLPRRDIAAVAITKSFLLKCDTIEQAISFSNSYAPEHLILNLQDAESLVKDVMSAGSVFIGPYSCESCGDYASGTNHTLPTYGYARMYSGVSTS